MEVNIRKLSTGDNLNVCVLPKNIFYTLKLSEKGSYAIHFGATVQNSIINFSEAKEKNMYFPEKVFNQLHLLEYSSYNIWRINNDIYLGPVVGIFVSDSFIKAAIKNKYHYFISQHIRASYVENCLSYFFSAYDVDWSEKKVKGYTFIPELNRYDTCWLPLPDVLYYKIDGTRRKERLLISSLLKKFKNYTDMKLINNLNMLDKWEVCEALAKHPQAKMHMPETIDYSSFDDVLYMLYKYKFAFVKSYYGCGGREVLSVEKLTNKYKLNYYKMGAKEIFLDNIDEVEKFVIKFVGRKKFIVQQGIRSLTYNGRSTDIRMYMMKNEYGIWESIFKGVRIAKKDFNIANIKAGGSYIIYEELYPLLRKQYSHVKIPSAEELNEVSIMLSGYIEKELGAFGEIGVDLAIDTNGHIWILEANSNPGKLVPSLLDINGKPWVDIVPKYYYGTIKGNRVSPLALGIFKYARFLTGTGKS